MLVLSIELSMHKTNSMAYTYAELYLFVSFFLRGSVCAYDSHRYVAGGPARDHFDTRLRAPSTFAAQVK